MVTVSICFLDAPSTGMKDGQLAGRSREAESSDDSRDRSAALGCPGGLWENGKWRFKGPSQGQRIKEEYCPCS